MTRGQHRHRPVLGRRVVEQQPDRQHVVVAVRIERRVLVHLDGRADVAAFEVQLAVVKAERGPISSATTSRMGDSRASHA